MRLILVILASLCFLSPRAQTGLPVGIMNFMPGPAYPVYHSLNDSDHLNRNWYFSKSIGISSGLIFYKGGATSFISAPVGLQLNHPLNNNLIAFAGVSAAPTFLNFSHAFVDPALNKNYPAYPFSNSYGFGMNARVEMGLMYVNDAKTFSISGSIGVEKGSYPLYPTQRTYTRKQ